MAYNGKIADRVRVAIKGKRGWNEKKMFGGIAFMLKAMMCVGVLRDDLVVRVGPDGNAAALAEPHTRPMDFTGKPMKGYVYVSAKGTATDASLAKWIERGVHLVNGVGGRSTAGSRNKETKEKRRAGAGGKG